MKANAVVAMGLLAAAGAASAAAPTGTGLTGALGDELYYNYVEAYYDLAYLDQGGRNERVFSDSAYGVSGSVFLLDPLYFLASYDSKEFNYDASATSRVRIETEQTAVGLGARVPIAYATDLFANATYELTDGFERASAATTTTTSLDADGYGLELGGRSFISGAAEIQLSYRYRETQAKKRSATNNRFEEWTSQSVVVGAVVPVYKLFSLFARAEIGNVDSSFQASDDDFETYLLGGRLNFRF